MSNQPPSDPLQPGNPAQPYGPQPPDDDRQVSGQPWQPTSGDPLADNPITPAGPRPPEPGRPAMPDPATPMPPAHPTFQPGYASPPSPGMGNVPQTEPDHPPTAQFPAHPGSEYGTSPYGPPPGHGGPGYGEPGHHTPGYGEPGYGPPPPPKRSNAPLIAVILAVTVLLCGGAVTAGVLVVQNVADRAQEVVEPIAQPTLPTLPTEVPNLPSEIPGLPTELPDLPTDLPGLPGSGKKITVVYEVTGDGPAEIVYTQKLGESPKRVAKAKLPWKVTTTMEGAALVSVTAVRSAADSGTISCRATVDGEEVAQRSREGSFATASCTKLILN